MSADTLLYWLLPALPALLNLTVAWSAEVILPRFGCKPWQVAHCGRMAGIVVFVLCALVFYSSGYFDYHSYFLKQFPVTFIDALSVVVTIGILFLFQRRQLAAGVPAGMERYSFAALAIPQLLLHALVWILYLLLYEAYFRGYLLLYAFSDQHISVAVIYNVVLYALVHLYKNVQQVVAAVPFGLLLCIVTVWSGHLWYAWIVHVWLALGFEWPLLSKRNFEPVKQ